MKQLEGIKMHTLFYLFYSLTRHLNPLSNPKAPPSLCPPHMVLMSLPMSTIAIVNSHAFVVGSCSQLATTTSLCTATTMCCTHWR
ncbi:hypothetical protein JHK86_050748 [Glycine max]|nr:hypothetical protein JHK86_050748 [Glycine max]